MRTWWLGSRSFNEESKTILFWVPRYHSCVIPTFMGTQVWLFCFVVPGNPRVIIIQEWKCKKREEYEKYYLCTFVPLYFFLYPPKILFFHHVPPLTKKKKKRVLYCLLSSWPSRHHALAPICFSYLPTSLYCNKSTLHSSQASLCRPPLTQTLGFCELRLFSTSKNHLSWNRELESYFLL